MSAGAAGKGDIFVGDDDVQHSKDDALNEREFELLVEGSYRLDDDYFELESRATIFLAGRFGLRAGEIAHMKADWIDWHRGMIEIPRFDRCHDGRDGGICGHCRGAAKQMVETHEDLTLEAAEELMWSPKTEAAAREIPLEASTRGRIVLERYFERFDEYHVSRGIVNRRVKRAARAADAEIDAESTYPHCLRSSAASRLAAQGIDIVSLKSMLGWADFQTAEKYLSESGERTARALRQL